ncbi:hypothetical protein Pan97_12750 [Bremerella volcania]|uniref:Secreted protein n=1 Tax=Bremerella volcania TaxID=2527984 RepID=A0A518C4W3_9BACT|nr:hypothetical protein [Bremerella volcania]QDU74268.1 hypothetical protein Pan97_12750 [Bremerella volcania]
MPRRATAMMAVLAVIIHCVLGCCARCLSAGEHHDHADACQTGCLCCEHHHHDARPQLCLQPATSEVPAETTSETVPHPDEQCLGCGKAKCAFIQDESACDGLTDALLGPVDLAWLDTACLAIESDPQFHPPRFSERSTLLLTPKLRLHLSLAVLTL